MRLKIFKLILFFIFCFKNSESNNYYQKLSDFFSFKNNDPKDNKFKVKKRLFNILKNSFGVLFALYILKKIFMDYSSTESKILEEKEILVEKKKIYEFIKKYTESSKLKRELLFYSLIDRWSKLPQDQKFIILI